MSRPKLSTTFIACTCHWCSKSFEKAAVEIKRSGLNFCSKDCTLTYQNFQKIEARAKDNFPIEEERVCVRCRIRKPFSAYAKHKKMISGIERKCKQCRFETRNVKLRKERDLKKKYNLSLLDYENMRLIQENKCKICTKEKKLFVDHCHTTGKVRGLLCATCNVGLGSYLDNTELLKEAIKYLDKSREEV